MSYYFITWVLIIFYHFAQFMAQIVGIVLVGIVFLHLTLC